MKQHSDDKITCNTPTPGKGAKNILRGKYDLVRQAIRMVVPKNKTGLLFRELTREVKKCLTAQQLKDLGALNWYVTTVKLHMETLGELERVADAVPQRLRLVK